MPADEPESSSMPRVDPERAAQLAQNLGRVLSAISSARQAAAQGASSSVRLIAVSKLKPAADILALHESEHKQQYFGENYVQELEQKAALLPRSIKWSFIGGLQSNKCAALAHIPNLWSVNSVDRIKLVDALEKGRRAWAESAAVEAQDKEDTRLRVFVQVNTSGEDTKSGVSPGSQVVDICKHVQAQAHLKLQGLMTIGALARSRASGQGEEENEDFNVLVRERDGVAKQLGLDPALLELSMGMSQDFEPAVRMGSSEVRVGSTIFGDRPPRSEAKIV